MTCGHGGFLKCFMTLSMFSNIVGHPIHVDGHIETIGNNNVVHTIYQLTIHNIGGPCCRFQYSIGFKIWCAMYNYLFNESTPLLEGWRWAKVPSIGGIVTKTYLQEMPPTAFKWWYLLQIALISNKQSIFFTIIYYFL